MRIYESETVNCSLKSQKGHIFKHDDIKHIYICPEVFELIIEGAVKILWPNREGESFYIKDVFPLLQSKNLVNEGLSIGWPATSMCQGIMFFSEYKSEAPSSFLFHAIDDCGGRYREIRLLADDCNKLRIRFSGKQCRWEFVERSRSVAFDCAKNKKLAEQSFMFQVGFKDSEGTSIPDTNFGILPDLAKRFSQIVGKNTSSEKPSIIHLFGYGAGHDVGYPDYTPADDLGGSDGLCKAADEIHEKRFLLSCYLNARLVQVELIEKFPELMSSRCVTADGTYVIERYGNHEFFVMNPCSAIWEEYLFEQAIMLKSCGADAVQLDQVAGRAPAVSVGEEWGRGYKALINRLHAEGLKVWIQGVSDYYPADWFEMTYRELSILPGGVLRGGTPFGKTDLCLLKALMPDDEKDRCFIVPLKKAPLIKDSGLSIIVDLLTMDGSPPFYGKDYLDKLSSLI
ncbi:MAG: hypothetical protein PQJ46_14405 [Spirochaetales bacterium]|nr:hypothetical protein [Spirochaetales bacterium]